MYLEDIERPRDLITVVYRPKKIIEIVGRIPNGLPDGRKLSLLSIPAPNWEFLPPPKISCLSSVAAIPQKNASVPQIELEWGLTSQIFFFVMSYLYLY